MPHSTLHYHLATTTEQMDEVFALRYACYRAKNAIDDIPGERFHDAFDQLPNHFSFLLKTPAAAALATVRISVVRADTPNWTACPALKVFGDHPALQAIAQGSFVEASRLCFAEQARRDVLYSLVAHMAALADFHEVDWLIACPRAEHSLIYQRLFGFQRLGAARQYFGVKFATELLGIRREDLQRLTYQTPAVQAALARATRTLRSLPAGV